MTKKRIEILNSERGQALQQLIVRVCKGAVDSLEILDMIARLYEETYSRYHTALVLESDLWEQMKQFIKASDPNYQLLALQYIPYFEPDTQRKLWKEAFTVNLEFKNYLQHIQGIREQYLRHQKFLENDYQMNITILELGQQIAKIDRTSWINWLLVYRRKKRKALAMKHQKLMNRRHLSAQMQFSAHEFKASIEQRAYQLSLSFPLIFPAKS